MAGSRFVLPSQQPVQATGLPYAGGQLFFYLTGTSTPTPTYSDSLLTIPNTNPVILDSAGDAGNVFLNPSIVYKVVLEDANGNLVWSFDPVTPNALGTITALLWGATTTGVANAQLATSSGFSAQSGQAIVAVAGFSNSGPMTLNGGTGPLPVYLASETGPEPLVGGEVVVGNLYVWVYNPYYNSNAGGLQLLNPSASIAPVQWNYIGGLTLSNDGTTPNSVLDIAAGSANDSTNFYVIQLGAFTKSTAGAWAAGSGANGMGDGLTIAASTWYHVMLAENGGAPDIWFDTSVTGANKPSAILGSYYRRIGSFKTDGSSHILAFTQRGNEFLWTTPTVDVSGATITATPALKTLASVPLGLEINALFNASANATAGASSGLLIYPPDASGSIAGNTWSLYGTTQNTIAAGQFNIRTNSAQQVEMVISGSNMVVYVTTNGWIDLRGQT
jgi:hypothetical protein